MNRVRPVPPDALRSPSSEGESLPFATEESLYAAHRHSKVERGARVDLIIFHLGPEEYAAEVGHVVKVRGLPVLTQVPGVPRFTLGLFSFEGTMVPVIDLKARLGLSFAASAVDETGTIIVAMPSEPESKIGLLVDWPMQVAQAPVVALQPAPPGLHSVDPEMVKGILLLDPVVARRARKPVPADSTGSAPVPSKEKRLVVLLDLEVLLDPGKLRTEV